MDAEPLTPPLPEGARLLHIGIPKTGTTALQSAAARARADLLRHGVVYPGRGVNHLDPVCALMGRSFGSSSEGDPLVPPPARWSELLAELERRPGSRALISHEFASESSEQQARRFVSELGAERTFVVVTLRSFAALLGSSWQQYVKAGRRTPFPTWLRQVLHEQPSGKAARLFYRRNDQPAILQRWIGVVGVERVIVIVPDKRRPELLLNAFADLLEVPRSLLAQPVAEGENRSMSWPETEYLRRLNRAVRQRLDWREYELLVRNGAVRRMLTARVPGRGEPRVTLPAWAAERAEAIAAEYAAAVTESGCRIIGDATALSAPAAIGEPGPARTLPMDAAVASAAGLISAGLGRGADFDVTERPLPPAARRLTRSTRGRRLVELNQAVPTARAGDLVAVGLMRAGRQLRRRISRQT